MESDPLLRPHGRQGRRRLRALRVRLCELCVEGQTGRICSSPTCPPRIGGRPARRRWHRGQRPVETSRGGDRLCASSCARPTISGRLCEAGGQPGSLSAWQDAAVNAATRGFFADTLRTIQPPISTDACRLPGLLPRKRPARRGGDRRRDVRHPISPCLDRATARPLGRRSCRGASPDGRRRQGIGGRRGRPRTNIARRRPRRRSTSWSSWPTRRTG